ncbi:hypothetical protein M1M07_14240 [Rhodococcus sp. HM1]|uniref:hypothetical protein n=1 Tax=Rhodococcus sp. HM1 TaxID=2937759 RepID=UPI00200A3807|nr:hypothetical protein [Rhodococcus sp. HM1]MCK8672260.1 hypothetical protein [Rhodococcus sp. HM1]
MHRIIHADALFRLGPEQTWDLVFGNRLQRFVELSPSIVAVEDYEMRANGTPRYTIAFRVGPITIRRISDYSVYDRPNRTVNAVLGGPFGGTYETVFGPEGPDTRLSYRWRIEPNTPAARVLLPVLAPLLARALRRDLRAIASAARGTPRGEKRSTAR